MKMKLSPKLCIKLFQQVQVTANSASGTHPPSPNRFYNPISLTFPQGQPRLHGCATQLHPTPNFTTNMQYHYRPFARRHPPRRWNNQIRRRRNVHWGIPKGRVRHPTLTLQPKFCCICSTLASYMMRQLCDHSAVCQWLQLHGPNVTHIVSSRSEFV